MSDRVAPSDALEYLLEAAKMKQDAEGDVHITVSELVSMIDCAMKAVRFAEKLDEFERTNTAPEQNKPKIKHESRHRPDHSFTVIDGGLNDVE